MKRIHLCLLYGGRSGEHEVSLISAASIFRHLDRKKYLVVPMGISKSGVWYKQHFDNHEGPSLPLAEDEDAVVSVVPGRGLYVSGAEVRVDFFFPILHGTFGEDGTVQGLFELLGAPYAGAGVLASAVGMDKEMAKRLWDYAGLPVTPWRGFSRNAYEGNPKAAESLCAELGLPLFVKPVCAGSSVGITKVKCLESLHEAIVSAFCYDRRVLVEKAIDAREIECSLLGNEDIRVFAPGEVIPNREFYDYDAKYVDPEGAFLRVPADLPEDTRRRIKTIAEKAYRVLDMRGMARLDFFLDKKTQTLYLNEINTLPGFTSISMFPRMCEAEGLAYPDLLDRIIELGFAQWRERENVRFSR